MGSFNVACSASNISISEGTDVAFLFLQPSKNYKIKDTLKEILETYI